MSLLDDLSTLENLNYAWRKAKNFFHSADGYIDNAEITAFELNLEKELASIQEDFRQGSYTLRPLRPLPRPKKLEKGKAVDRQYFHISVRDQVAWIALTNILGPRLDPLMPAWSYNYRIYRTAWYDEDEVRESQKLEIGPYRHASGQLYRKFQQSWPLFRRHVARTARLMSGADHSATHTAEEDEAEQRAFLAGQADGLAYFSSGFWRRPANAKGPYIFHAALDLERFFPSISRRAVLAALVQYLVPEDRSSLESLLKRMLAFQVDVSDVPPQFMRDVEPPFDEFNGDNGIPTGLFAAGFLSNVVLLPVDQKVEVLLKDSRKIAHFRYVDDHTFLAYDFDDLCRWINQYCELLAEAKIGAKINSRKFDPKSLGEYLQLQSQNPDGLPEGYKETLDNAYNNALNEARIDGSNRQSC